MEYISHIVGYLSTHRFLVFAACMILFFLFIFRGGKIRKTFGALLLIYGIINIIIGPMINAKFLNEFGTLADGMVTGIFKTSTLYNEEPVYRYETLIRKPDGSSLETSFTSMDFNVYPASTKGIRLPTAGVQFKIKYVPGAESNFIIMADERSEFVDQQECMTLLANIAQAESKLGFDSENENYKNLLRTNIEQYINIDCGNQFLKDHYKKMLDSLQ